MVQVLDPENGCMCYIVCARWVSVSIADSQAGSPVIYNPVTTILQGLVPVFYGHSFLFFSTAQRP